MYMLTPANTATAAMTPDVVETDARYSTFFRAMGLEWIEIAYAAKNFALTAGGPRE